MSYISGKSLFVSSLPAARTPSENRKHCVVEDESSLESSSTSSISNVVEKDMALQHKEDWKQRGKRLVAEFRDVFLEGHSSNTPCTCDDGTEQSFSTQCSDSESNDGEDVTRDLFDNEFDLSQEAMRLHLSTIAMQLAHDSSNSPDILLSCVCKRPFCSALCLYNNADDVRTDEHKPASS